MGKTYRTALHSIMFIAGFSLVFVSLGVLAGLFPEFLHAYKRALTLLGGAVILFFGLYLTGLFRIFAFEKEYRILEFSNYSGFLRSFFVGLGFAAGWTPCIGPILAGMFALAAGTADSIFDSALLFMIFSVGIGLPFFISALALGYFFEFFKRFKRAIKYVEITAGVVLILVGVLLITDTWTIINTWLLALTPYSSVETTVFERHGLTYGIAFLGGLFAFLSPCILPLVPSYIAYITGVSVEVLAQRDAEQEQLQKNS